MTDYIQVLKSELLEQFKDKPKFNDFMEAVGVQLNEVAEFYEQLRGERSVDSAVGKQLDRIGDIVVLSRDEVSRETGKNDDETYRRYIIYKILKNTCRCTYYDIMSVINMFWNGPPLIYSESLDDPAKIRFYFEASPELQDEILCIPYIKAGGVGLQITEHKTDNAKMYVGFAARRGQRYSVSCNTPVLVEKTYLADELGTIMADENGAWLVE